MDWFILLAIVWGIWTVAGRRGGCSWRGSGRWLDDADSSTGVSSASARHGLPRAGGAGHSPWRSGGDVVRSRPRARRAHEPKAPAESPMQSLQRRFVDGSLTVEEYERELDRLLRKG